MNEKNMADLWKVSRCADIVSLSQQHLQVWSQPFSFNQHRHALLPGSPCQHQCTLCEATIKVDQLCIVKGLADGVWGEVLWKVGGTGSMDAGSGATCSMQRTCLCLLCRCHFVEVSGTTFGLYCIGHCKCSGVLERPKHKLMDIRIEGMQKCALK